MHPRPRWSGGGPQPTGTGRRREDDRIGQEVVVAAGAVALDGHLTVPEGASGAVVFAHGSGSSRHSPRNVAVAAVLNRAGLATLLFDLLSPSEAGDRSLVFDIPLLGGRLGDATDWLRRHLGAGGIPVGYFGASTGAGAALWAAADDAGVAAVVSRGGRPDLAGLRLASVVAPTLLIVGSRDPVVLDVNREAAAQMRCEHEVSVVDGASHLFEEPGTLPAAAGLAVEWFHRHFGSTGTAR